MATIIDTFVIALGYDVSAMASGQKTAEAALKKTDAEADRVAKQIAHSGKQAAEFFTRLRNEALTFFAVLTAGKGIEAFIKDAVSANYALDIQAENLGMSAKELTAYGRAAERTGGSVEGMAAQLQQSQEAIAKYQKGFSDDSIQAFYRYGGDPTALKDGNTYLLARADILKRINDTQGAGAAQLAAKQMGISPDEYNVLRRGASAFQDLVREQEKHITLTDQERQKIADLRQSWLDLEEDFQQDRLPKILAAWSPEIDKAIKGLDSLLQRFAKWSQTADAKQRFDELTGSLRDLGAALKNVDWEGFGGGLLEVVKGADRLAGFLTTIASFTGRKLAQAEVNLDSTGQYSDATKERMRRENSGFWNESNDDGKKKPPSEPSSSSHAAVSPSSGSAPRGVRNNNPGNIRYGKFAADQGATGQDDGGFAVFPNAASGAQAAATLLRSYMREGNDTVSKIINKWAPKNDHNDTDAYVAFVSKALNVSPNDKLNDAQVGALARAMFIQEGNARVLAVASQNAYAATGSTSARSSTLNSNNSHSSKVNVATINILTQATDAQGISSDLAAHLERRMIVPQSNPGLA